MSIEDETKIIQIDPFKEKMSRADLQYVPKVRDLKDAMFTGDLSKKEDRELLAKIIGNYECRG